MSVAESESLLRAASQSSAAARGAVELDDTQRHQKVTQWSGLLIAIDMIAIVLGAIIFGVGIHMELQGYGGDAVAVVIGLCGLSTVMLGVLGFYGVKKMEAEKFAAGLPFVRWYFNFGTLIVVLLLVFSFGLLATRNLALKYVEMYWSGKMELVFANMSLAQALAYVRSSIAIFCVLCILVCIAVGFSLFGVSQIIQSAATQQQAYLWANLAVAASGATLIATGIYQSQRPPVSQILSSTEVSFALVLGAVLAVVALIAMLRSSQGTSLQALLCDSCTDRPGSKIPIIHAMVLCFALVCSMYLTIAAGVRASSLQLDAAAGSWSQSLSPSYYKLPQSSYEDYAAFNNPSASLFSRMSVLAYQAMSVLHAKVGVATFVTLLSAIDIVLCFAIYFAFTHQGNATAHASKSE